MTTIIHATVRPGGLTLLLLFAALWGPSSASAQHATEVTVSGHDILVSSHIELWGRDAVALEAFAERLSDDLEQVFDRAGAGRRYKCYRVHFAFDVTTRVVTWFGRAETLAFRADDGRHHLLILDVSDPVVLAEFRRTGLYDARLFDRSFRDALVPRCAWYFSSEYDLACARAFHVTNRRSGWAERGRYCRDGDLCEPTLGSGHGVATNDGTWTALHEIGHLIGMAHNHDIGVGNGLMQRATFGDPPLTIHHENLQNLLSGQQLECRWELEQQITIREHARAECCSCPEYIEPISGWEEDGTFTVSFWSDEGDITGYGTLRPTRLDYTYDCASDGEGDWVPSSPECTSYYLPGMWELDPRSTYLRSAEATGGAEGEVQIWLGTRSTLAPTEVVSCVFPHACPPAAHAEPDHCNCGPPAERMPNLLQGAFVDTVHGGERFLSFRVGETLEFDRLTFSTIPTGRFLHEDPWHECSVLGGGRYDVVVSEPTLTSTPMRGRMP